MLTLNLEKPGVESPKLQLSLNKGAQFSVIIFWDCDPAHKDDMDTHAFEVVDGKVLGYENILSTYNTKKMSRTGVLEVAADGSFATPSGGLHHSADIRVQGNSETIEIDGSKLPDGVNEVPIFATVHATDEEHHDEAEEGEEAAFADIEIVTVTITDDRGTKLGEYTLSKEFGEFNAVQLGTIMRSDNGGWQYVAVGRGFNGDLNQVLAYFS